tara:strand:+ start:1404 stop:2876 length:1473 start_codon:yes stop_codon:yes gene_type:complete
MGFFDRAERERVIDKRMAEVKAAAQKRRAEETDQTGAFSEEYPEEEGVGKALPEGYKTSQTEFNPDDFSYNTDPSLQSDRDEEFNPDDFSYNTDPSLQSDRDEVETKKTPEDAAEDAAEDDTTEYYDTTFGHYEAPRKDQLRNLAFVGPLLDYMGGSTLEESGLVKGVAESAFAAGEDVFQTVAGAKEHLATPEGTRHGRVISRVLSSNPIFQFVRGVNQAWDLGQDISDWARGKSEEAYGGEAQTAEEFNPDDFSYNTDPSLQSDRDEEVATAPKGTVAYNTQQIYSDMGETGAQDDVTALALKVAPAMIYLESRGNPKAMFDKTHYYGSKESKGSAGGLFQFVDRTWEETLDKHAPEYMHLSGQEKNDLKLNDVKLHARMGLRFTEDNIRALKKMGVPLEPAAVYTAHFLGLRGATRFYRNLKENPNGNITEWLSEAGVNNNPGLTMTKGKPHSTKEFYNRVKKVMEARRIQSLGDGNSQVTSLDLWA